MGCCSNDSKAKADREDERRNKSLRRDESDSEDERQRRRKEKKEKERLRKGEKSTDRDEMDKIARRKEGRLPPPRKSKTPKELTNLENAGCCYHCLPCCFGPYYCCPPDHPLGRPVHYDVIEPYLDTGDLVLFVGKDVSDLIRVMSKSRWSHCGIVVRDPAYDEVLMFEATLDKEIDVDTGKLTNGVQLVRLRDRMKNYETEKFAIRRLFDYKRTDETLEIVDKVKKELKGRKFETNWAEFFRAGYEGPGGRNVREHLDSLFCSELVAEIYQRLGVLPNWENDGKKDRGAAPSNEYAPVDFQEGSGLKLKRGRLGPEIPITFNMKAKGSKSNSYSDSRK